jgi:hypothetical protein
VSPPSTRSWRFACFKSVAGHGSSRIIAHTSPGTDEAMAVPKVFSHTIFCFLVCLANPGCPLLTSSIDRWSSYHRIDAGARTMSESQRCGSSDLCFRVRPDKNSSTSPDIYFRLTHNRFYPFSRNPTDDYLANCVCLVTGLQVVTTSTTSLASSPTFCNSDGPRGLLPFFL